MLGITDDVSFTWRRAALKSHLAHGGTSGWWFEHVGSGQDHAWRARGIPGEKAGPLTSMLEVTLAGRELRRRGPLWRRLVKGGAHVVLGIVALSLVAWLYAVVGAVGCGP